MHNLFIYLIGAAVSYLFGGIPFGFVIVKVLKGIDVRTVGSGNIGATNAARVLGKGAFAAVFVLDFLKGILPVILFAPILVYFSENAAPVNLKVVLGLFAILGHIFTPYLKLRGGKGVATSCGVFFGLALPATAVALLVWLAVFGVSRYVSLSSICAAVALPIAFMLTGDDPLEKEIVITLFCIAVALLVIVRHTSNIKRLLKGTERKFGKKKEGAQHQV